MQFPTITDCRCYHKEAIVGQGQEHHICSSPICQTNSETLTLCGEGPRKISVSCPLIFASSSTVKNIPDLPYYLPDYLGFFERHTDALSFPWLATMSSLVRDQKTAMCRTVTFLWAMTWLLCSASPQCVSPDEACTSLDAAMIWTMMQNKKTFTKPLAVIHQADYKGENGGLNLLLVKIPKTHMVKEMDLHLHGVTRMHTCMHTDTWNVSSDLHLHGMTHLHTCMSIDTHSNISSDLHLHEMTHMYTCTHRDTQQCFLHLHSVTHVHGHTE